MKRKPNRILLTNTPSTAVERSYDYGPALQSAVSWLGDRYLLAEPVRRRVEPEKSFFVQQRRWHPVTKH